MKRAATTFTEWSRLTGRHKLAVVLLAFWVGVSVRIFLSGDSMWITAQAANYGTLTVGVLGFAAASLGLTKWADVQMAQIPTSTQPPIGDAA